MRNPESGHVKNVMNFTDLISRAERFGTVYNPADASLKLTALKATQTKGQDAIREVSESVSHYKLVVGDRNNLFDPLSKLTTRIILALMLSRVPASRVKNAKSFVRKIRGERAKKINPENVEEKHISASQMSFDNRVANFQLLIDLLQGIPEYKPNEKDLQVSALIALHKSMFEANIEVINAASALRRARTIRDKILYTPITGIYYIALDVKRYFRLLFGITSEEYSEVRTLSFRKKRTIKR